MASKRPFYQLPWHQPSDQPDRIHDRALKRQMRLTALGEYARTAATVAWSGALIAAHVPQVLRQFAAPTPQRDPLDFLGVAIDPWAAPQAEQIALLRDLGIKRVLVRAPVWALDQLPQLRAFTDAIPECQVMVAILQDRASVCYPQRWLQACQQIVRAFAGRTNEFQIGQAPNRTKWGCVHMGDYFTLAEHAMRLRDEFPQVVLAGPSIIDFEPAVGIRSLINNRQFQFDVSSALLYVDRRGAPGAKQYGWFDLRRKIAFQVAINQCSKRLTIPGRSRLWITETNWPLQGSGQSAPTSPKECVSEADAARYLLDYYRIAWGTGAVERVYWWQLVAPGYGLVDNRQGLRTRPTFAAMASLAHGAELL